MGGLDLALLMDDHLEADLDRGRGCTGSCCFFSSAVTLPPPSSQKGFPALRSGNPFGAIALCIGGEESVPGFHAQP